jgi:hypothetical protein
MMASPADVPETSFLGAFSRGGAYADCYTAVVEGAVDLPTFIESFYTTRLFKLERWLLARLAALPSTDEQARQLAHARTQRFAAWTVAQRSATEILLDAGQTRSWLCVEPLDHPVPATRLYFGSAVVPMRPGGRFGWAFYALLGFHRGYSKSLLRAAARKVKALPGTRAR